MDERLELPDELYRDAGHCDWKRCLYQIGLDLNVLANDVYRCWNNRVPPPLSVVLAIRYLKKELDVARAFAEKK